MKLEGRIWKDEKTKYWVVYVPLLDISTQGRTKKQALAMIEDAFQIITRVQQELTKRILVHNDEHLPITFSAGVASRNPGEDQTLLIKHADDALYKAKRSGKNCVVVLD